MKRLILVLLLGLSTAQAADINLAPVTITATRSQTNSFDIPMAVEVLDEEVVKNSKFSFTPADSLRRASGLNVTDTFMQDIRIVSRGFGSYANFATRGILFYRDGIPVSMADGFSSSSLIDMNTINRIEVLKGPFSSLYGNTAAGVMQVFTEVPTKPNEITTKFLFGSYNTSEQSYKYSGIDGNGKYLISHSEYSTDGVRDFSALERNQTSIDYWINPSIDTKVKVAVHNYSQSGNDYGNGNGGITVSRYQTNPYSVEDAIYNINSWKNLRQTDASIKVDHNIDNNNLVSVSLWGGVRTQQQLQPKSACSTILTCSSEKLDTDRQFYGSEVRYDHLGLVLNKPYKVSFGMQYSDQSDNVTNGTWMTNGVLATDQGNTYTKHAIQANTFFDQYAQGMIQLTPTIDVHAGIRRTDADIKFTDKLTSTAFGGDNGGSINYTNALPSIGVNWKVLPTTNLYASYGKGQETPNIQHVQSASASATSGPNTTLKAAESDNYEIGIKSFAVPKTYLTAAVYSSKVKDEIGLALNTGGYKVYSNQGNATRRGVELAAQSELPYGFGSYLMYNYIDATFDSTGNKIAGIPQDNMFGELSWKYKPASFKISGEMIYNGKSYATTDNTVAIDSYTIFNLKASLKQEIKKLSITEYVAVNNIGDKVFVEAANVDGAYSRYFATGAARNYMMGVNASYNF